VENQEGEVVKFSGTLEGETRQATVTFMGNDAIEMSMEGETETAVFKRVK
jgi:hypothetical protein